MSNRNDYDSYDTLYGTRQLEVEFPGQRRGALRRGHIPDDIIGDVTVSLDLFKFMDGTAGFRKWVVRVFNERFRRGDWGNLPDELYYRQTDALSKGDIPFYGRYHYDKDEIDICIVCSNHHTHISYADDTNFMGGVIKL